jgi:hypothetical protein
MPTSSTSGKFATIGDDILISPLATVVDIFVSD